MSIRRQAARPPRFRPVTVLVATVSPLGCAVLAILVVLQATLPILGIIAVGRLVGAAGDLADDPAAAVGPFALLAVAWIGEQLCQPATALVVGRISRQVKAAVDDRVLAASLGHERVDHMFDPAFVDRLAAARGSAGNLPPDRAVGALAALATARLTGLAAAGTLATVIWWAPVPLVIGWVLAGKWIAAQFRLLVTGFQQRTGELRRATYLFGLCTDPPAAKEVLVFGLGRWFGARFAEHWYTGMAALFAPSAGRSSAAGRIAVLLAAHVLVFVTLALASARGGLPLADLTVAAQAAIALSPLGWAGDAQWTFDSAAASVRASADLPVSRPRASVTPVPHEPRRVPPRIRFEGVSFHYPGRDRPALDGVDLTVPAGSRLAVVGANGAGKSTLLRLLCGLHAPGTGRITVDGVDLAGLPQQVWRQRLAVVLQDFLRFDVLTARENVGFGRHDVPWTDADLAAATTDAGIADVVAALPRGWETELSRQFSDGMELSGGQWQRLALARALFAVRHGAGVLVLDEPSAQLDARAEARLYDRFLELTNGVTTMLVSHRFNTVRLADRICVLRHGRIVELGNHDSLMAADGHYARMFAQQAERFTAGRS